MAVEVNEGSVGRQFHPKSAKPARPHREDSDKREENNHRALERLVHHSSNTRQLLSRADDQNHFL
jgi:hypothetical protein